VIWEVVKILFHALMVVLSQAMIVAALYHLWVHCSLAMALWTAIAIWTLVMYTGGYRVLAWCWGMGDR